MLLECLVNVTSYNFIIIIIPIITDTKYYKTCKYLTKLHKFIRILWLNMKYLVWFWVRWETLFLLHMSIVKDTDFAISFWVCCPVYMFCNIPCLNLSGDINKLYYHPPFPAATLSNAFRFSSKGVSFPFPLTLSVFFCLMITYVAIFSFSWFPSKAKKKTGYNWLCALRWLLFSLC